MSTRPAFLEDLIDACVMESYFREHMAERDLLFHNTVAPHLAKVEQTFLSGPASNESRQECLNYKVRTVLQKALKTPLHFVDLKHEQRVPYIRRVGDLPLRTVSVLIYKPLIREPEKFQSTKYLLYRYATRLLLERV